MRNDPANEKPGPAWRRANRARGLQVLMTAPPNEKPAPAKRKPAADSLPPQAIHN